VEHVPKSANEKVVEAKKLYRKGNKLVDIAKHLNVPEGTIRRWKSTYQWDVDSPQKSKENARKKTNVTNAEKANVRSPAGGAPLGSQNHLTHGGYSAIYWDTLDDEERELIEALDMGEETQLLDQIRLFTVRERRLLVAIKKVRSKETDQTLESVTRSENKRHFKSPEEKSEYEELQAQKVSDGKILPGEDYHLTTTTESTNGAILRLEQELTRVQRAKRESIETLHRVMLEKDSSLSADVSKDSGVVIYVPDNRRDKEDVP
jgi:uncharacterized protein YjcR